MKIFAIRNDNDKIKKDYGFLFCAPNKEYFHIEIASDISTVEAPIAFESSLRQNSLTLPDTIAKRWVRERIIPSDRQNIGMILKNHRLKEYNEYNMLMLAKGRCCQDEFFLSEISGEELPEEIKARLRYTVNRVIPLSQGSLLVVFATGEVKKCSLNGMNLNRHFDGIIKNPEKFKAVKILPGGFGIVWNDALSIPYISLYGYGHDISIDSKELDLMFLNGIINTAEAADINSCSRQYINELVRTQKIQPIKSTERCNLFWKSDIERLF